MSAGDFVNNNFGFYKYYGALHLADLGAGRQRDSPLSREKNRGDTDRPDKVTDGPWLFQTKTGKLGMLWISWIYDVYTQGVVYSESGTLDGPWVREKEPVAPPNFGHGMLFRTFDGKLLMFIHSHRSVNGRTIRYPKLFEVDDSGTRRW